MGGQTLFFNKLHTFSRSDRDGVAAGSDARPFHCVILTGYSDAWGTDVRNPPSMGSGMRSNSPKILIVSIYFKKFQNYNTELLINIKNAKSYWFTIFIRLSLYRSPLTLAHMARISASSASVSSICAAAMFSSRRAGLVVPGMGIKQSPCFRIQASTSCAGVHGGRAAASCWNLRARWRFAGKFSGEKRGMLRRKSSSGRSCGLLYFPVRKPYIICI